MEILDHVMPPLLSLRVGEVREGSGARPNLEKERPLLSEVSQNPVCQGTVFTHTLGAAHVVPLLSVLQSTNNLKRLVKFCLRAASAAFQIPERQEWSVQEQHYKCGAFRTCISEYDFQRMDPKTNSLK